MGASACTICSEGYSRPNADSPATQCTACSALRGVLCRFNSTADKLLLKRGWWRLSPYAVRAYECKSKDNSSVCTGGGTFGDLACASNHSGPRCESCLLENYYFDADEATCQECGTVWRSTVSVVAMLAFTVVCMVTLYVLQHQEARGGGWRFGRLRRALHSCKRLIVNTGMIPKVKSFLAFAQVVASLETTYSIGLPPMWFRWSEAHVRILLGHA